MVPSFRSVCVSSIFRAKFNNRVTLRLEYSSNFRGSLHSWCCCWSFKLNQLAHRCIFNNISRNIAIMFICSQSCDYHLLKQNPLTLVGSWFHPFFPLKDEHCGWLAVSGQHAALNLAHGCHLCPSGFSEDRRPPSVSSPRCLLHCLQVNTGATRACLCLCSKQPSLLWLQSKQVRQRLHMSSFVLIEHRRQLLTDLRWNTNTFAHWAPTNAPEKVKSREAPAQRCFVLFFHSLLFYFGLFSPDLWRDHKTLRTGCTGRGCILLGVRAGKKGPFVTGDMMFFSFYEICLHWWLFLRWGCHVTSFCVPLFVQIQCNNIRSKLSYIQDQLPVLIFSLLQNACYWIYFSSNIKKRFI